MTGDIILASGSEIRTQLLHRAGVHHVSIPARIDEDSVIQALSHAGETSRNIADALADAKADKVSRKHPNAFVIGSDQILSLNDRVFQKADNRDALARQLSELQGQSHVLTSAVVVYHDAKPQWRHVGQVRMTMRDLTRPQIEDYVEKHWDNIQYCVGGYRYEDEGIRLFTQVEGDYFHVLGIPLLELINYLHTRGVIT